VVDKQGEEGDSPNNRSQLYSIIVKTFRDEFQLFSFLEPRIVFLFDPRAM
jgi:hypothetical protein